MTQPLRREPLRKIAAILGVLSICLSGMLGLTVATASANPTLDAETRIDCDSAQEYEDAGDADIAEDLSDDGYSCTALLNKGPLNSSDTIDQVGELWYLNDDGDLSLRIIIFDGANNDYDGDAKVCLDDDVDPINDIQAGGDQTLFCEGQDAGWKIDAGDPVPAADADEEDAGLFEVLVDGVEGIDEDPGGWDLDINDFTEVAIHFNISNGLSIVAYFQPDGTPETTTPGVTWQEPDCDNQNTADYTGTNSDFTYAVTSGSLAPKSPVTVTATLKDGVDKTVTGTTTFPHTFDDAETGCDGQTTPTVTFTEPDCRNENTAGWIGTNDDFTYALTSGEVGPGESIVITATLKDGVDKTVTGDTTIDHTFDDAETDCEQQPGTTSASVVFKDPTCSSNSVGWTPGNTDEITYTVTDGAVAFGEEVEITATVKEGVDKTLTGQTVFTHVFGDRRTSCGGGGGSRTPTTTTTAPVLGFTPDAEVSPDVIVAPAPTPELALTPEVETAAPAPQLPFTGGDSSTLTMWAVGLLGLGALLIVGSRKRATA